MRGSLAAVVLLVAPVLSFAQESGTEKAEVLLRYQFGENDEQILRTTTTLHQEQTVNDQKFETDFSTTDVSIRTLEKKDDEGRLHLQSENKRLHVKVDVGPLGKYEFDSASTERDKGSALGSALTPLYERLSGAYLWTTISPRGEVTGTRGYAELVKDVIGDNPIAAQFAGGGTDEAAKAGAAQMFVAWPEKAIAPGETWESEFKLDLPKIGEVLGKTKFTFDKIVEEEGVRIAEFTTKPELSIDIEIEQAGAKIGGRLQTEKAKGRIRFDLDKGRLLSRSESYTIAGTLHVSAAGQELMIPMSQTQDVKVELLDELPE